MREVLKMFQFRSIRSKIVAAFAVPVVVLVAVASLEVISSTSQVDKVDHEAALATTSVGPGGVVQALQNEREDAILSVLAAAKGLPAGLRGITPATAGFASGPAEAELLTDRSLAQFENSVHNFGGQVASDYQNAITTINDYLVPARRLWLHLAKGSLAGPASLEANVYQDYTSVIGALISASSQVPLQVTDPTLRTGVEALDASLSKTESDWRVLQDLLATAWAPPGPAFSQAADQATLDLGAEQALSQRLSGLATGDYANAVNILSSSTVGQSLQTEGVSLVQHGSAPLLPAILSAFNEPAPQYSGSSSQASTGATNLVTVGDSAIAAVISKRAKQLRNNAVLQAEEFGAVALVAVLLGLSLVVAVSRSISRPLVQLARKAEKLASEELPAAVQAVLAGDEAAKAPPVEVPGQDEVAEVARALDAVSTTALELAGSQAALRRNLAGAFLNLGRRNQNLVTRQLEYISEIELKEPDPASLEELFRLDHLATRMRRNAESLLILAGSGPARPWSAPVAAMDVVRAASAEVEDYQRLRLHHFDHALVTGSVTTDLVHILAELIENALQFSPPESPVDIYGHRLEEGYVIAIVDSGIGMSPEDLQLANARLQGQLSSDAVPGRYLGHFVAGRLASALGIAVALQRSQSGGLIARVKIPASAIEGPVADLSAQADRQLEPLADEAPANEAPVASATAGEAQVHEAPVVAPTAGKAPAGTATASKAPATERDEAPKAPLGSSAAGKAIPDEPEGTNEPGRTDDTEGAKSVADIIGTRPRLASRFGIAPKIPLKGAVPAEAKRDGTEGPSNLSTGLGKQAEPEVEAAPEASVAPEIGMEPEDGTGREAVVGPDARVEPEAEERAATTALGPMPAYNRNYEAKPRSWSDFAYVNEDFDKEAAATATAQAQGAEADLGPAPTEIEAPGDSEQKPRAWSEAWSISWDHPLQKPTGAEAQRPSPLGAATSPSAAGQDNGYEPSVPDLSMPERAVRASLGTSSRFSAPPPKTDVGVANLGLAGTGTSAQGAAGSAAAPARPPAASLGPAAQAASTAAGLRKLTRRVPGASLAQQDDSLRRTTPTTTANARGLAGALSQYLSATVGENRPAKEEED
ncbi:MAG: ATP-binding protein [Acidimicrobiales bacterium]